MPTERPILVEREGEVMTSAGRDLGSPPAGHGNRGLACNGSVEGVLVGNGDTRMLDGATARRLARRIGEAKKTERKTKRKKTHERELKVMLEIVVGAAAGTLLMACAVQIGLWTLRIRRP